MGSTLVPVNGNQVGNTLEHANSVWFPQPVENGETATEDGSFSHNACSRNPGEITLSHEQKPTDSVFLIFRVRTHLIRGSGFHSLRLFKFALDICQFFTGLEALEDNPIRPGRFLAWVDVNVKNPKEPAVKQTRVIQTTSWVYDHLPLVAFRRVVGDFDWKILESRVENQNTSDILKTGSRQIPKCPR